MYRELFRTKIGEYLYVYYELEFFSLYTIFLFFVKFNCKNRITKKTRQIKILKFLLILYIHISDN